MNAHVHDPRWCRLIEAVRHIYRNPGSSRDTSCPRDMKATESSVFNGHQRIHTPAIETTNRRTAFRSLLAVAPHHNLSIFFISTARLAHLGRSRLLHYMMDGCGCLKNLCSDGPHDADPRVEHECLAELDARRRATRATGNKGASPLLKTVRSICLVGCAGRLLIYVVYIHRITTSNETPPTQTWNGCVYPSRSDSSLETCWGGRQDVPLQER